MRILKATEFDCHELAVTHTLCWQSAYKGIINANYLSSIDIKKKAEQFRKDISDDNNVLFFKAVSSESIVGLLIIDVQKGELVAIYLLPQYQHIGFGKKLLEYALQQFSNSFIENVFIWVLSANQNARNFYEKNFFSLGKETKKIKFGNHEETLVRYERNIIDLPLNTHF